jgi:hypothetical protein
MQARIQNQAFHCHQSPRLSGERAGNGNAHSLAQYFAIRERLVREGRRYPKICQGILLNSAVLHRGLVGRVAEH